jgi:hypothetical protein
MTRAAPKERRSLLDKFVAQAAMLFAASPKYRSAMLVVAQYWNDQADDECHARVVVSTRDLPVWPHVCDDYADEIWDDEASAMVPNPARREGEGCDRCMYKTLPFRLHLSPPAWEAYCHEHANQDQELGEAYLPYAIARPGPGGVEIEIVGVLQRPWLELVTDDHPQAAWPDRHARELFAQICAAPDDNGPRIVLGDHLLETRKHAVDPRGEYLSLVFARSLDVEGRARRAQLLAAHERDWLAPLGPVIPIGCAWFERGFLARASVYARGELPAKLRDAETWGTVEVVRMLPGSDDLIVPAMTALRDVGPVGPLGALALATAARPWRIETLHLVTPLDDLDAPLSPALLPRLRHLILGEAALEPGLDTVLDGLRAWPTLERVTLTMDHGPMAASFAALRIRHRRLGVRELAVALRGENREPAGWQVVFGPDDTVELAMAGWHPAARFESLVTLVRQLPNDLTIRCASSDCYRLTADDLDQLTRRAGRPIDLGATR